MTTSTYPDTISVRYQTLGHWLDLFRTATLSEFTTHLLPDGTVLISAEVTGPDPAHALQVFIDRHASYLANRLDRCPGDQLPVLDVSVEGQTGYLWRTCGVWVQLWHSDTVADPSTATTTPGRDEMPARASTRLPFTRRPTTTKENAR